MNLSEKVPKLGRTRDGGERGNTSLLRPGEKHWTHTRVVSQEPTHPGLVHWIKGKLAGKKSFRGLIGGMPGSAEGMVRARTYIHQETEKEISTVSSAEGYGADMVEIRSRRADILAP